MVRPATRKRPTIAARRLKFLNHLSKTANVSRSARLAGVSTSALYQHRATNPGFARQWDDAIGAALDELEQAVIDRAKHGVEKPVFFRGEKVGAVRNYSDALAMFLLKAKRPEVYARLNADTVADSPDDAAREEILRRLDRLGDA